ncbi:MAG: AEC family transporter [Deltaproteobacteria bacterium]|nr:AEC family transporter [Deltaproteobacteria bacterium]
MPALLTIFLDVVVPGIALMALGAIVHRRKALNLDTLVKLNLYAFVPGFLFVRVAESKFGWETVGLTGVALVVPMLLVGSAAFLLLRTLGLSYQRVSANTAGALFFNAGNFGIPVALLAFGNKGGEVQALVVVYMNTLIFFAGYVLLSVGHSDGLKGAVRRYLALPMPYAIAMGFLIRSTGWVQDGPPIALAWLWTSARLISAAMVPVALITLGAQIANKTPWPVWRVTGPVVFVKLLILPLATGVISYWMGLWPWPAAGLILASSAPTAVNIMLLTMEIGGDPEEITACVFWTTLLSSATVAPILFVLRMLGGAALPTP